MLDDYEGDDAADGQIENHHYPVIQHAKAEVSRIIDSTKLESDHHLWCLHNNQKPISYEISY